MRPTLLLWALGAVFSVFAAADEGGPQSTVFNDIEVPPLQDIDGLKFEETVKSGYWFIKFFSPYCVHCRRAAPFFQTLYEFYATSSPLEGRTKDAHPDLNSPNSFHGYYNFHFAQLNCIAYGDLCEKNNIQAWPMFVLFKDGEMVEKYEGDRSIKDFSRFVEEQLEKIKPGSRPRNGVKVPEVGAKSIDRLEPPVRDEAKDKNPTAGAAAGIKQNAKDAVAAADAKLTASSTGKKGNKSGVKPNPHGKSVPLTAESFQKLVTTSQDPWFVKFYAPWCHHCQHLAPTWSEMAKDLGGKLNIGEVNCDAEPRLCKDAQVSAYPTIYFFRGGERVEYDGLRGLGGLLRFAHSAIDSDVKQVNAAEFSEMEKTEEVIFVYFYDHATTSEDFAALDRLTLSLIGHAKIVKTDSEVLAQRFKIHTWPRLLVVRSGRPTFYTALAPKDMRDFRKVLKWMQSVWLPIVPELTAANAKEIMTGKIAVLGILQRDKTDAFLESKNELKNAALEWMEKQTLQFQLERQELRDAKQLRIEEAEDRDDQRALRQAKSRVVSISEDDFRKQVRFAWVDAIFWERWLRKTYGFDLAAGERVIIADEDNRRYWDLTDTGNFITASRTSILETLPRVVSSPPKLAPKSTVGMIEGALFRTRNMFVHHFWVSMLILVSGVGLLFYLVKSGTLRHSAWRGVNGGGYFRLDEKSGILGNSNGKVE